ncbi:MAG TPA: hypothetical protein VFZ25_04900 [Chloroflexota bacterium]|nr:hypothetical protein [Chloroflexota bacterium]
MREPLTLSRTVSVHGPAARPVGAKAIRGPTLPGLDSLTEPGSLGRRAALLAGLFVLGLALGWLVTQPFVGRPGQPVTMSEYSTVVALLYQRDHNLDLARERLALFGIPTDLVGAATRDASVTAPADQAALSTLGQSLTGQAAAATPAAQSADTTDNQAAAGIASSQSATTADQHTSLLGPILAFVFALLLGSAVLLRTAGLSASSLGLSALRVGGARPNERRSPRGTIRVENVRSRAEASDVETNSERPVPASRSGRPVIETRPIGRTAVEPAGGEARTADRRTAGRARVPAFQSAYHLGDDPYDEIHPITDPTTGSLVAACGLSAALKHIGRGSEYFAFTAWLQNYADDEQLNAAGLVAPGARDFAQDQIQSWVRGGQIDALVPIEKGMRAELGTGELAATVTILDVEFGDQPGAPRSYLKKLVVRFDVQT